MIKGFTHESTYNESKEWYTPRYIFDAMGLEFDLDPCSPGKEIVPWIPATRHLDFLDNGLTTHWEGRVWMNPPYGQDTPKWMERLSIAGNGIALVFSRTDTLWFHRFVPKADAVCFIKGRVQFVAAERAEKYAAGKVKPKGGCGAGSILIAYGKDNAKALFRSGLGLTLPVSRNMETVVMDGASQVAATIANENLPRISEGGQGNLFRGKL